MARLLCPAPSPTSRMLNSRPALTRSSPSLGPAFFPFFHHWASSPAPTRVHQERRFPFELGGPPGGSPRRYPSGGHGGGYYGGGSGGGGRGGGGGGDRDDEGASNSNKRWRWGLAEALAEGWRERVRADSQFPFKIVTEEVIGVGASVLGDMACRPNFGLGELDFIFSNMVVCFIVNFALMYILAPTPSAVAATLPGIFASCPRGHMWEAGAYSVAQRAGTFMYKGAVFATVGFGAGLMGTALSKLLLNVRKKVDPGFLLQNAPPPTVLNASTWALQLGVSSNFRYQVLNGLEFGVKGAMKPDFFKGLVFAVRSLNNVVGGMSFVMMARLTGSQQETPKRRGGAQLEVVPPPRLGHRSFA